MVKVVCTNCRNKMFRVRQRPMYDPFCRPCYRAIYKKRKPVPSRDRVSRPKTYKKGTNAEGRR